MGKFNPCVHLFVFPFVCDRWKDIGTIAHNKSAITVEITSRDDTIIFHMVSVVSAGGLGTHKHALYKVSSGKLNKKSTNTFLDIPVQRQIQGLEFL